MYISWICLSAFCCRVIICHVHGPMSDFSEPTSSIYKGINKNNSSDDIHDYLTDNTDLKADKTQNSQ